MSLMPWLGLVSRSELCLIIDGPCLMAWHDWRAESGAGGVGGGELSTESHQATTVWGPSSHHLAQDTSSQQANPTVPPSYNGTSISSSTATGAIITTLSSPQQILQEDGHWTARRGLSDSFQVQKIHYFQPVEDHHKSKDSIKGQKIFCQLFKYLAV